jgi:predicted DsbA family dithiol-disulfide isomerase
MRIDIWSDISCPWCYLAQARFGKALDAFAHRNAVQVVHRSFELDATLRKGDAEPIVKVLMNKIGFTEEQALANEENLSRQTAREGLGYVMDRDHGSTLDMHRLLHLAKRKGVQHELIGIFFRANFAEQRSVFDDDERLVELATEAGLDAAEVRTVLTDPDVYTDAVRADEAEATRVGATSVPFFLFDGKFSLAGAQPLTHYSRALERAWT